MVLELNNDFTEMKAHEINLRKVLFSQGYCLIS